MFKVSEKKYNRKQRVVRELPTALSISINDLTCPKANYPGPVLIFLDYVTASLC